jgi:hypothetical protein
VKSKFRGCTTIVFGRIRRQNVAKRRVLRALRFNYKKWKEPSKFGALAIKILECLFRTIKNRGAPLRIGVYPTAMELINDMGVDQKVWLNSAKLIISLNQVWQRILSETRYPTVEPSTKIGHLEGIPTA